MCKMSSLVQMILLCWCSWLQPPQGTFRATSLHFNEAFFLSRGCWTLTWFFRQDIIQPLTLSQQV